MIALSFQRTINLCEKLGTMIGLMSYDEVNEGNYALNEPKFQVYELVSAMISK